ncbi:MAG: GerMN domain-containing protein [Lachnospiraceae bacterium]|nr:GerMN domain-containing protein [Lachnospiraceae bacterium]
MKRRWKYLVLAGLIWLTSLVLAGCKAEADSTEEELPVYQIYYLNPAMTRLVSQEYRTGTTETDYLIQELMDQFQNVPAYVDCQAALSDKVVYQGYRQEDIVLYLYFDNNYTSMKSYREILCRAALARTLTQIPGIEYINIYSGQQPLMDSGGMPVGMVSASDFIDSISDVNAYERTELTLYFTDGQGELLYPEKREVVHNINTSLEQVILGELISGPEQGLMPTLDPQTRLLNVSVNENVCYLNFDTTFLNNQLEVKEYIPIYSIVNSLSELSTVNRVQITINGEQNATFRDSVSLSAPFGRNLDYIGGTDN